jgi:glycosyltransferase involved in cell wall biosynthesis
MISIIIPTYNHLSDCLKPCCESIIRHASPDQIEVIVVANGCTDGTEEYIRSLGEPFKLISLSKPAGYPRAVNTGLKLATGDYIVLLNNDTVILDSPKDAWLNILKEPFNLIPTCGITGPSGSGVHLLMLIFLYFSA